MKLVIQLVLWIVIIFLGYLIFNAIYEPIQFNKVKEKRYAKVIENLRDIPISIRVNPSEVLQQIEKV